MEQPSTPEFPFGVPDHDAVAVASGTYYAVSSYAQAVETETVPLEDIDPVAISDTQKVAWHNYRRACYASIRSLGETPVALAIKYAVQCAERVEASTSELAPVSADCRGRVSPDVQRRMETEGQEMALFEAIEYSKADRLELALHRAFSPEQVLVLKTSLIHAAATADVKWRRDEMLWLADHYGFDTVAEMIAEMRAFGMNGVMERLSGAMSGVVKGLQMVGALSHATLLDR